MPTPPAIGPARRTVILTGLGFALGFGWLWFPALQGFWLPEFLWGGFFAGGGTSLFCILLLAGFFSVAVLEKHFGTTRLFRAIGLRTDDPEFFNQGAWAPHAATLFLMTAALLPPVAVAGARLYLPVFCMALAALLQGLFWGGAILVLPPRLAAASFVVAPLPPPYSAALSLSLPPAPASRGRSCCFWPCLRPGRRHMALPVP
jgi:hypothetical protein